MQEFSKIIFSPSDKKKLKPLYNLQLAERAHIGEIFEAKAIIEKILNDAFIFHCDTTRFSPISHEEGEQSILERRNHNP